MSDIMEYISVVEFSKRINENKAKAYTIIEREEYRDYVRVINGTKKVSVELVEIYLNGYSENTYKKPLEEKIVEDKEIKSKSKEVLTDIQWKELYNIQLERVRELERQIQEKDKVILDYANKFAEMATQAQNIAVSALTTTGQAQYLQATQQKEQHTEAIEEYKPVEKKSFWQRLFNK